MSLFEFELRPIELIQPWGAPEAKTLSWFGLSDGWYWLSLGGQEVLRATGVRANGELPYVGYQVARLWEDILDILPSVLEPVPEDIAALVNDADAWKHYRDRLHADAVADEDRWMGIAWANQRELDSAHLVCAPRVYIWRVNNDVHIAWASQSEGRDLWASVRGVSSMPVDHFLQELRSFNSRFLGLMGERVRTVVSSGGLPDVHIDLERLQAEQQERSAWLKWTPFFGPPASLQIEAAPR